MLNKTILIKDAIIALKPIDEPVFGSIQFGRPAKPNTIVTIQTNNMNAQIPLSKIKLAIFKLDAKTFAFIFHNGLYCGQESFDYWNTKTKQLASHELQPNF